MLARHLHTPIPDLEEMDWDRFELYAGALGDVLRMESPNKS